MTTIRLRSATTDDWSEVAELICVSTNFWYQAQGKPPIFPNGPDSTRLFLEVYEALDPGCCVVAEHSTTRRIVGSCFYHPRETHFSLGIMNVHPNYFGRGVAKQILDLIIEESRRAQKPLRLVSSAMNLDSFSLYTRAGFVPRQAFQDMFLQVPDEGLAVSLPGTDRIRKANIEDVSEMARLELEVAGISREKDYRYFIENEADYWHTSVFVDVSGQLCGFLVSISHPGLTMIGPGVAKTAEQAAALLVSELNHRRGCMPVFLLPVDCSPLVQTAYRIGAKNCELHFAQVLGEFRSINGVVMPTFMPETA